MGVLCGLLLLAAVIPIAGLIGDRKNAVAFPAAIPQGEPESAFEGVWFPDGYVSRVYVLASGGAGEFRLYQNSQLFERRALRWVATSTRLKVQWSVSDGHVEVDYQLTDANHMQSDTGERWNRLAGGIDALNGVERKVGR